jgi:hypothetical protein
MRVTKTVTTDAADPMDASVRPPRAPARPAPAGSGLQVLGEPVVVNTTLDRDRRAALFGATPIEVEPCQSGWFAR